MINRVEIQEKEEQKLLEKQLERQKELEEIYPFFR